MKRTLWSILAATAAAVLPGFAGPTVDLAAPLQEAIKPVAEAVAPKKVDVREAVRTEDDHDDDPAPVERLEVPAPAFGPIRAERAIVAAPMRPEVTPLARRALGRPRARAPDRTA